MRGLRAHYHLLPDQDEEQPTECTEPNSEEQPGWEGAPVTPPAPEEPCRLVLSTPSSILQEREIEEQEPWSLLYCTARDGFSLRTLYRCTGQLSSPALLLIRDTEAQAFGAFSTSPIHVSSGFYGTGETFLFSFSPELKVFRWTGRNSFFLKGDTDLLMVGGGRHREGRCGRNPAGCRPCSGVLWCTRCPAGPALPAAPLDTAWQRWARPPEGHESGAVCVLGEK
ncbi:TLD domain-containing protein 2 isoform X2 [Lagopus leucura]|uniref:TLD domain-containing protein 2 isoform X2 n=1 Tax=Lagopus leucura TaxID=30410 RepID=UPI001C672423|nr:TLD domain-containing protein 2 isoform X2 [Lagopus leucura]